MSVRIRYACPHCSRRIVHHPELAGQLVICSVCKGEFYEPTDPLPGKAAEKALEPKPEATRRLRVPEGNNPRHDLAVLSPGEGASMRSITEIVEAVLLDEEPAPPSSPSSSSSKPAHDAASRSEETLIDFSDAIEQSPGPLYQPASPQRPPAAIPVRPAGPPLVGPGLAGPSVRPLVPQQPQSYVPSKVVSAPQVLRSVPTTSAPSAIPVKPPAAVPGLAGASIKQMVDEIRRRGKGAALVTCDLSPLQNFELTFSDNMTRDDALALFRRYLDTLKESAPKSEEQPGLLKRIWGKKEE